MWLLQWLMSFWCWGEAFDIGQLLLEGEGGANFGGRDFAWLPPLPSCWHQCSSAQFVACFVYNALAASISWFWLNIFSQSTTQRYNWSKLVTLFLAVTWQLNRWPCHSLTHSLTESLSEPLLIFGIYDMSLNIMTILDNFVIYGIQFRQFLILFVDSFG